MTNAEAGRILEESGGLLDLQGETPFESRAYFHAAQTIRALDGSVQERIASGRSEGSTAKSRKSNDLVIARLCEAIASGLLRKAAQ